MNKEFSILSTDKLSRTHTGLMHGHQDPTKASDKGKIDVEAKYRVCQVDDQSAIDIDFNKGCNKISGSSE